MRKKFNENVSISQSSLGRFTRPSLVLTNPHCLGFNLAIEFGPVHAVSPSQRPGQPARFNLAIEFGPVHARLSCTDRSGDSWFQSRNRVWAGSRLIESVLLHVQTQVSISQSSLGRFTHALAMPAAAGSYTGFNLAIEFGPVHAPQVVFAGLPGDGFNLAIEFGPVHARLAWFASSGSLRFQSRNRVWAGSRYHPAFPVLPESVFQSRNRVWAGSRVAHLRPHRRRAQRIRFNLAIEFGPVHAPPRPPTLDFPEVSISQSSLGRFTR